MCIRDSGWTIRVRLSDEAEPVYTRVTDASGRFRFDNLPWGTYTPVSYTHLRAHETVLDLVCRLLLAKKKTILN